jgi:hypothetical protein
MLRPAWEFAKALHHQRQNAWARYVSIQDHCNLLTREEEREVLPLCIDDGVGTIPWSPLARGRRTTTSASPLPPAGTATARLAVDGRMAAQPMRPDDIDRPPAKCRGEARRPVPAFGAGRYGFARRAYDRQGPPPWPSELIPPESADSERGSDLL